MRRRSQPVRQSRPHEPRSAGLIHRCEEFRYAPTELPSQEGGGAAARAPPPCPLTPQRSEGPPATRCRREPPTGGMAAAFSPRCPAAACGSRDKAPTTTTAIWDTSFQRRTQIVSTKTYVLRSRLVRQKPGLFFGEILTPRIVSNPRTRDAIPLRFLLPAHHRNAVVPHDSFVRLSPRATSSNHT